MKKCLLFVLLLLTAILILSSCGKKTPDPTSAASTAPGDPATPTEGETAPPTAGQTEPETTEPSDEEFVIFAPGRIPSVVFGANATGTDRSATDRIRSMIRSATGVSVPAPKSDAGEVEGAEIVIGFTTRPITQAAKAIYDNLPADEDHVSWVIYASGGSLAILFSDHTYALEGAFLALGNYVRDAQTLALPDGFTVSGTVTVSERTAYLESKEKEAAMEDFALRWEQAEATLDASTVAALKALTEFYGTDVLTVWSAGLWDPAIGGFYYSNDARDYDDFLPDIESTYQTLNFLRGSGAADFYGGLADALPQEMVRKIIAFVNSLEDESDGYFYHPQWGKDIGSSRKGRDLTWAKNIYNWFGAKAPYPTALDRLSGNTAGSVTLNRLLADQLVTKLNPPLRNTSMLDSEEALLEWLRGLNVNRDSHSAGHAIASIGDQIIAAGLGTACCDYLDSIQYASSGMWQEEANYTSLSGVFKISTVYAKMGRPMKYLDKMVDSAIAVILSDVDPSIVIYVYNPIIALNNIFSSMKTQNKLTPGAYDLSAFYAKIRARGVEIAATTMNKLALFRKADGSFSYNQKSSAPYTQGTRVSYGSDEGDMNATSIAVSYIWNALISDFGLDPIPLYSVRECDAFLENIAAQQPIVKKSIGTFSYDFENSGDGLLPTGIVNGGGASEALVAADPKDPSNHALLIDSKAGTGTKVFYNVPHTEQTPKALIFETDLMVESSSVSYAFQLTLGNTNEGLYMLDLLVEGENVVLRENATNKSTTYVTRFDAATWKVGEWVKLRIESYPGSAETTRFKIYKNDVCVAIGTRFYGSDADGATPIPDYQTIQFYVMKAADLRIWFDNMSHSVSTDKVFSDSDYQAPEEPPAPEPIRQVVYDFESGLPDGFTKTFSSAGASGTTMEIAADPTDPTGHVLALNKTDHVLGGGNTNLGFSTPLDFSGAASLSVSFDFYLDAVSIQKGQASDSDDLTRLNHTIFQIAIGDFLANANEAIYMMTMTVNTSLDGVQLGDSLSTSKGGDKFGPTLELDRWYTIRIDLNLADTADAFTAVVSVDGTPVKTSTTYFNQNQTSGKAPNTTCSSINIRPLARAVVLAYFDNLSAIVTTSD